MQIHMDASGEHWLICDLAVGPLPQHSPYPQHPRRVFRCDLPCPALQAQVVAGVHRSWFRCRQGLGGVRLCKFCGISLERMRHRSATLHMVTASEDVSYDCQRCGVTVSR